MVFTFSLYIFHLVLFSILTEVPYSSLLQNSSKIESKICHQFLVGIFSVIISSFSSLHIFVDNLFCVHFQATVNILRMYFLVNRKLFYFKKIYLYSVVKSTQNLFKVDKAKFNNGNRDFRQIQVNDFYKSFKVSFVRPSQKNDFVIAPKTPPSKTIACPSTIDRSSHRRCPVRKGVLRNFANFTGKHLCQSFFFNKVTGAACNFV